MEVYCSINKSIKCVVLALSNTCAREVLVTTLTYDDVASYNLLTTKNLNTKSL